ncbi:hypothetical protein AYI69_g3537 [Smittium culicis]|uniref:Uncharacterized protein n=1 Tax=Smittium culicis TaxID=133412 RepID=A0A1R1YJI4_9FUNG|nr:hypothetical protein AYI69_g3537 [Smittium culicis]
MFGFGCQKLRPLPSRLVVRARGNCHGHEQPTQFIVHVVIHQLWLLVNQRRNRGRLVRRLTTTIHLWLHLSPRLHLWR